MVVGDRLHVAVIKETADVEERARWTRNTQKKDARTKKWSEKSWYDDYSRQFGLSRPRIKTNADQDAEWECKELLGRGSFGVVGLWTKSDSSGKVIDVSIVGQHTHRLGLTNIGCRYQTNRCRTT